MSNIREIYTKALLARGTQDITLEHVLQLKQPSTSILGCWIVNHQHQAYVRDKKAYVKGDYDVHLWYSYEDVLSDVHVEHIEYNQQIDLIYFDAKKFRDCDEALSECDEEPKCTKATIVDQHNVEIELVLVISVNVIGQTMIKIEIKEDESEYNQINPDFIK